MEQTGIHSFKGNTSIKPECFYINCYKNTNLDRISYKTIDTAGTELNKTMYAKQSVNVRDLPAVEGNLLGGLSYAQEIKVLGQCTETNWYKIECSGGVGYVSNDYVVDNRPVQETQSPSH